MTKTPSHPPFYFIVTFWGEKFSKLFLDVCLSSLLSPNNIPVLNEDRRSKFLIVTTKQDWENIKNTRKFRYLSNFIEPVFINIGPFSKCTSKMQLMSQGHKLASKVAFADDALGVFLTPDLILSDGSVLTLKKYAIDGQQAVLCAAVRFSWEDCKDTLQALTYDDEHNRIILSPRQLNHLVLDKLHSETRRYDWQSNFYCTYPISSFWKLPNDQGIVIHTYSWAPLLLNYPAIIEHNTETFDSWTLDGDYVYQNFRDLNLITTITNSDELMLASFTPEAELSFEFRKHWLLDGYFSNSAKMSLLRRLHWSPEIDPLKRELIKIPVFWHKNGLLERLKNEGIKTAAIINKATRKEKGVIDDLIFIFIHFGARQFFVSSVHSIKQKLLAIVSTPKEFIDNRHLVSSAYNGLRVRLIAGADDMGLFSFVKIVLNALFTALDKTNFGVFSTAQGAIAPTRETSLLHHSGEGTTRAKLIFQPILKGKWYWEVKTGRLGLFNGKFSHLGHSGLMLKEHSMLKSVGLDDGWGYCFNGTKYCNGQPSSAGEKLTTTNDVIMIAFDADLKRLWFGKNGKWFRGTPSDSSKSDFEDVQVPVYPAVSLKKEDGQNIEIIVKSSKLSCEHPIPNGFSTFY